MRASLAGILVLGWLRGGAACGEEVASEAVRAASKATVAAWQTPLAAQYATDADIMLREGIMANRKTRRINFFAETTGLGASEVAEFFLIGEASGNAYEAIAVSLAQPQDLYDAMLFIGMSPGRGVDYDKLQFWPKGERVYLTIDGLRVESLIVDQQTGKPLDPLGLVFIGSRAIPVADGGTGVALAAQSRGPFAIAANYNEPESLFDVPYQAAQSAVYSKRTLNPEHEFPKGKCVPVVIEPEHKDGALRVRDLALQISCGTNTPPSLTTAHLTLKDRNGTELNTVPTLPAVLERFSRMNDDGQDPFVTLRIADDTALGQLRELALLLNTIDGPNGIRVEPPVPGQLYYKAFAPNEAFRIRENRYLQPWELRLNPEPDGSLTGTLTGTLTEITEIWTQGEAKPQIETEDHRIASPEAMCQLLTSRKPDVKVILIEAPASLTHGALMTYVAPAYPTHPIIHIFVTDP